MATTPDSGESFVREVDENLRRDQATEFARRYGGWIAAAVVLLLLAAGGWLFWQNRQQARAAEQGEQLSQTLQDIGDSNLATVPQRLEAISKSDVDGYRAAAMLTRAALAVQQNDRAAAIKLYAEVAADDGLPKPYRDVALLRGTALNFDTLKPEDVIARMTPLAKPGQPWFGSAAELTALAMLKQGRRADAAKLFLGIASDATVPDTLRGRAAQIAATLGADVSTLPAPRPQ